MRGCSANVWLSNVASHWETPHLCVLQAPRHCPLSTMQMSTHSNAWRNTFKVTELRYAIYLIYLFFQERKIKMMDISSIRKIMWRQRGPHPVTNAEKWACMLYSNIKSRETRGKYIDTYMYIYMFVYFFVCLWCKKVVLLLKHRDRTIVECYLENRLGTLADRNVSL